MEKLYLHSQKILNNKGFEQYELANWCKPKYQSRHNQKYWENEYYISVGSGACGYIPTKNSIGLRYQYEKNHRLFSKNILDKSSIEQALQKNKPHPLLKVEQRNNEHWLIEYISSSIRTQKGINLKTIKNITKKIFEPNDLIKKAIQQQQISQVNGTLKLKKTEWFRENYWALEILECF